MDVRVVVVLLAVWWYGDGGITWSELRITYLICGSRVMWKKDISFYNLKN
jgi:hypothetical protein